MRAPAPLSRRLALVTGFRLALFTILLGWLGWHALRSDGREPSPTAEMALETLVVAFALSALYAGILRSGRHLQELVVAQIVLDPILWTMIVYLSGGPSSGATSFYALGCLIGALLTGFRGAALSLVLGAVCMTTMLVGLSAGWLRPPLDQPAELYLISTAEFIYTGGVNLVAMLVVTLLSGNLAERLRDAGGQLVQAEQRAAHAERLATLGRVATALAHEIRNPLGAISGSIQLLRDSPSLSTEDHKLCSIIVREARRLDELVSDMMNLASPRPPHRVCTDAAETARDVVALASESGRAISDVAIRYEGVSRAPVDADAAQLRQLTWNLVRNAVQASHAGGSVVIRVLIRKDGQYELEVQDDGVGLDDDARSQIFDAFFTTRAKGTGVGLAVVKRISDDHGFEITVDSEAGKGALFRVRLGNPVPGPIGVPAARAPHPTLFPDGA